MTDFWKHATPEQRLAQIDGAIELHMNAIQCAMNCGTEPYNIRSFANRNNRYFGHDTDGGRRQRTAALEVGKITQIRKGYERAGFDPSNSPMARIFDDEHESGNLFDPIPYEEGAFT